MLGYSRQAGPSSNLGKHHDHELSPVVQAPVFALGTEAILLDFSKIMSVKKLKSASGGKENCVRMCHGLNLSSFQWVVANHTISRKARFGPILFS